MHRSEDVRIDEVLKEIDCVEEGEDLLGLLARLPRYFEWHFFWRIVRSVSNADVCFFLKDESRGACKIARS